MGIKELIIILIVGAIGGMLGGMYLPKGAAVQEVTAEERIKEFYEIEAAVSVSPHGLRKHMGDESYILVDLRSAEEYETAHIVGAVNVPAYANPNQSDYGAVDRIVSSFRTLQAEHPDKEIITYCYSMPCMTSRKIGKILADHEIYVKHLNIGWQEWRYYWDLWNHDGETPVNPEDYVATGTEPGIFKGQAGQSCGLEGEFGC